MNTFTKLSRRSEDEHRACDTCTVRRRGTFLIWQAAYTLKESELATARERLDGAGATEARLKACSTHTSLFTPLLFTLAPSLLQAVKSARGRHAERRQSLKYSPSRLSRQ